MGSPNYNADARPDESVALTVVRRVAEANGIEPDELSSSLYESVDPDALDDLFLGTGRRGGSPTLTVAFPFDDYEVVVSADRGLPVEVSLLEDAVDRASLS